jgi:hypothetical protein
MEEESDSSTKAIYMLELKLISSPPLRSLLAMGELCEEHIRYILTGFKRKMIKWFNGHGNGVLL